MVVNSEENINFQIIQGETFDLELTYAYTYQDRYQRETIDPIDITGYEIVAKFFDVPGSSNVIASCSIGDGITISNPATGTLDLQVVPSKTLIFNYPKTYYKITATDQYGQVVVFLQGWFDVTVGM